jgi:hypothetical protein
MYVCVLICLQQEVRVEQGAIFRLQCPYNPTALSKHHKRGHTGTPSLSLVVTLERAEIDEVDGTIDQGMVILFLRRLLLCVVHTRRHDQFNVPLAVGMTPSYSPLE